MENRIYGYARVSSREQNTDRQIETLMKFGVPETNIIVDKASGKDTEREGYQYLKRQILRRGDTLVIKELDRLSRSKTDIKRELESFKEMGVRVKILDLPTTLTDFPPEQLWVQEMVTAILIEVLGSIAENERMKIRVRQREGIEIAKREHKYTGRKAITITDEEFDAVYDRYMSREITKSKMAKLLHVSRNTLDKMIKERLENM